MRNNSFFNEIFILIEFQLIFVLAKKSVDLTFFLSVSFSITTKKKFAFELNFFTDNLKFQILELFRFIWSLLVKLTFRSRPSKWFWRIKGEEKFLVVKAYKNINITQPGRRHHWRGAQDHYKRFKTSLLLIG